VDDIVVKLAEKFEDFNISKPPLKHHLKNMCLTVKKPTFEAEARNAAHSKHKLRHLFRYPTHLCYTCTILVQLLKYSYKCRMINIYCLAFHLKTDFDTYKWLDFGLKTRSTSLSICLLMCFKTYFEPHSFILYQSKTVI
jgi:hypothetical protein